MTSQTGVADVDFRPRRWLGTGHAQTLFAAWQSDGRFPYVARQYQVATSDDDQLVVHDDCPPAWTPRNLAVLLIHGLGGSYLSPYMVRIAGKLNARGVRVFRMDMRGCGAGRTLARKPGHAGRSEDVRAVLEWIARECPDAPLGLVGFSLGGNLVLKTLGEWGTQAPPNVTGALAVAPPIDLVACARHIERPLNYLYNRWFVRCLLCEVTQRRASNPDLAELDLARLPRTLYEFDDRVTAPLSGFAGAREYYTSSSSAPLLERISVPTAILAAADDPIVPACVFHNVKTSKRVIVEMIRRGGHMGFFARPGPSFDGYWLDQRVLSWTGKL